MFTPFLARIYSPEAYGLFAFFASVTQNLGILATLQLPRAFVLPDAEEEFRLLMQSVLVCVTIFVLLIVVVLWTIGDSLLSLADVNHHYVHVLIFLIPLAVLLLALSDVLKSWHIRRKSFMRNALNQVGSAAVSRSSTLVYGVATSGHPLGLVFGDMIGKILEVISLGVRTMFREFVAHFSLTKAGFYASVRKYRSYPIFVLPGIWIQSIHSQLPVYAALFFFSQPAAAGHYSFANSLLNLPLSILGGAMAPVFLQKAAETHRSSPDDMRRIVASLVNNMFYIALLPTVCVMLFGDYIFKFILGQQWITSGKMASYMGTYVLFQILSNPIVSIYRVYRKEHFGLLVNSSAFITGVVSLGIGLYLNNFMVGIALFSGCNVVHHLLNIFVILKLVGLNPVRIIGKWLLFLAGAIAMVYLLRILIVPA